MRLITRTFEIILHKFDDARPAFDSQPALEVLHGKAVPLPTCLSPHISCDFCDE